MAQAQSPPRAQEWVTSFLKAQATANKSLECSQQHQILYDRSVTGGSNSVSAASSSVKSNLENVRAQVQTAVVSTFMSFPWSPICFAPYVGPGMLAAAVIPYSDSMSNSSFFHEAQYKCLGELMGSSGEPAESARGGRRFILNIRQMPGNVPAPLDPFDAMEADLGAKTLQVADQVSIDVSDAVPAENRQDYEDNHPSNAGTILAMKICGALAVRGYDCDTVYNVGSLVTRNLVTAYQHQVLNMHFDGGDDTSKPTIPVLTEDIEGQKKDGIVKPLISKMLRMLLDPTLKRSKTVHMNSNEVVLLINDLGEIDGISLRAVTSHTIAILQKDWNVFPVRVYAGHFMESHISGFSITLLNVVNTDIGGPSMIELLDAPCGAQGWNSFAIRETWYRHNMLSKEEKKPMSVVPDRDLQLSVSRDGAEEFDESSASEEDLEDMSAGETDTLNIPVSTKHTNRSINDSLSPPSTLPTAMIDHGTYVKKPDSPPTSPKADKVGPGGGGDDDEDLFPIEDVLGGSRKTSAQTAPPYSYEEPVRPPVVHPTWQHADEDHSLIDLIRTQAAKLELAATGKLSILATEENDQEDAVTAAQSAAQRAKSEDDDGFEMV